MEIKYVVLLAWGGLCLLFLYLYLGPELKKAHAFPGTRVSEEGNNDDAAAVEAVMGLLKTAKKEFEAYDDGNDEQELYNNQEFIDELERKLENPEFRVRAMFNVDNDLLFTQHFKKENPNRKGLVYIFVRENGDWDPVHYKIIDGGKKAYLTRHQFKNSERRFQWIDCSGVHKSLLPQANKLWFDDIRQKERNFRRVVGED